MELSETENNNQQKSADTKPVYSLSNSKSIVVQATIEQLTTIKTLLSLTESSQVVDLGNDIYELRISTVDEEVPEILRDVAVDDFDDPAPFRKITIKSFHRSSKFYSGAKGSTAYKIISDEFSEILNTELYKGFSIIERKLRQLVIENFQGKGRPSTSPRRASATIPDHIMAQFELGEFYERLLKSPASDGYMVEEWRKSSTKSEAEFLRISKLTVLDEIQPDLTYEELVMIRKQRNKCMHFNVVTVSEYSKIVPIMNKYLKSTASKEFMRSMKGVTEVLNRYVNSLFKNFDVSPIMKFANESAAEHFKGSEVLTEAIKNMIKPDSK